MVNAREGGETPPVSSSKTVTAARGAGTVLVRPLLTLYGASLSEEDQVWLGGKCTDGLIVSTKRLLWTAVLQILKYG